MKLAGKWELILEGEKAGTVDLPGALQAQGYGENVTKDTPFVQSLADPLWYEREEYRFGNANREKIPYMAQPPKTYYGKAGYRKVIDLKAGRYELFLEAVKWESRLFVDGMEIGSCDLLCTPHRYCFEMKESGEHEFILWIDNSWKYPYRPDGHEVSDALAATWNGVAGRIELRKRQKAWITELKVYPDILKKTAQVRLGLEIEPGSLEKLCVGLCCKENGLGVRITERTEIAANIQRQQLEFTLDFAGQIRLWDEFEQNLYTLEVVLEEISEETDADGACLKPDKRLDQTVTDFGFRKAEVRDGLFLINERPTYFRGTHFGGEYPLTGTTDVTSEYWDKIMLTLKRWGLNFLRCHSYCPPEAAFAAADRAGIYIQAECGMWNVFARDDAMCRRLDEETKRILDCFGNHPSFVMLSPSNEPAGEWELALKDWAAKWKNYDRRHLYTMQTGWPYSAAPGQLDESCGDYLYFHRSGFGIEPGGTIRNFKGFGGSDYRKSLEDCKFPVICHELGQWCSYPDFTVKEKFTGYMQPRNYEIFEASAKAHGVLQQNKSFVENSGRLQVQMYKDELEANFRTPHIYGFELLDLHDYLGQGTSIVGVLDPFWDEKGFIEPEEWRRFCSSTVPLLRLPRRMFYEKEEISYPVELCHFGKEPLVNVRITYMLIADDVVMEQKEYLLDKVELGKNLPLPKLMFTLPECRNALASQRMQLVIAIESEQVKTKNHWVLYVLPEKAKDQQGIPGIDIISKDCIVTENPVDALLGLREGKKVLLFAKEQVLALKNVTLRYFPIFWNAQMGPKKARTLGMIVSKDHPAFADFATQTYVEGQWETIMNHGSGIDVQSIAGRINNLAQPIDDWNRNKQLSMIFETRVGDGILLVAAFDPEAGESNHFLAQCLNNYLPMACCSADKQISEQEYQEIFFARQVRVQSMLEVKTDMLPARYVLTLPGKEKIRGVIYLPDQTSRNHEEEWKDVVLFCEGERTSAKLVSSFEAKEILFEKAIESDCVEITVNSIYDAAANPDNLEWKQKENGWYRQVRTRTERLEKLPEIYIIVDEDFVSDSSRRRFAEEPVSEPQTVYNEKRSDRQVFSGKKDIED